jgi:predicted permease
MKRWLRGQLERVRVLVRRGRFEADLDDELRFHLEESTRRNLERGMPPREARIAARRSLGRDDVTKDQVRNETGVHPVLNRLDAWWLDFKLGFRMLLKYPGLTLAGGLAMAVGIAICLGGTSAFHSMLRTPPLLEDVVTVLTWDVARGRRHGYGASLRDFVRWRDELQSLEDLSAFRHFQQRDLITEDGRGDPVNSADITPSAFRLFRVPPLMGRPLVLEDAREGAPPVVVVGHDIWRTRFGSDPTIVGREIRLGGTLHTVVGVMPEGFAYPVNHGLWTPLRTDMLSYEGDGPQVEIFGRLRAGIEREGAQAELRGLGLLEPTAITSTHENLRPGLVDYSARHVNVEDVPPGAIHLVQVFFTLLLLVPCANVAILVYARTARRQGEIAVRNALGASRRRIVTQLFAEALVLAAVAAVAALALVGFAFRQLNSLMAQIGSVSAEFPIWYKFSVSPSAVVYLLGLTVLAAAVVGVIPALQATGSRVYSGLRKVGGGTGIQLGRTWTVLIVAQVAITVAALPLAAGIAWSASRLGMSGPGFAAEEFLTARLVMGHDSPEHAVDVAEQQREHRARFEALWDLLESRLEAEPGVSGVTYARTIPGSFEWGMLAFEVEGVSSRPGSRGVRLRHNQVDVDFFELFEVQLLAGRQFVPDDRESGSGTVIVDRAFVEQVLGGASAVGRRARHVPWGDAEPGPWLQIVGVVESFPLNESTEPGVQGKVYSAVPPVSPALALRVGSTRDLSRRLREVVAELDPTVGIATPLPLDVVYRSRPDTTVARLMAWVLSLAILSLVFLSTAGIYALTSFAVTQRRREIGIRVALGAFPRRILGSIFSRAAMQLGLGIILGSAMAIPIAIYLRQIDLDLLVLDAPNVPWVLLAVAALVMAVGLAGSVGPARRGLSIQAADVLKEE